MPRYRRALLLAFVLIVGIDSFATALYWGAKLLVEDALRGSIVRTTSLVTEYVQYAGQTRLHDLTGKGYFKEIFLLDDEDNITYSTDPAAVLGAPRHVLWTDESEIEKARAGRPAAGFPYVAEGEHQLRGYALLGPDGPLLGVQAATPAFQALNRLARIYWAWILLSILLSALIAYFYVKTVREIEVERARAERGERFEMIGKMAATVAHEIRNPLNIMSATIELRRDELEKSQAERSEEFALMEDLGEEISRLERVVQDFLDLTRERALAIVRVDLNALIERVVAGEEKRLQAAGRNPCNFDLKLDSRVDHIHLDADRMLQMLTNLVRNAGDAARGGTVRIATRIDGEHVEIIVEDSGSGVSEDRREKIFEPFLTTKRDGSGLGLPVVKNIVTRHGGTIDVGHSSLGGALFRIVLPLFAPANEPESEGV